MSAFEGLNTGSFIIRSGLLLALFNETCGADKAHFAKFLAIIGNICYEDADNRNCIADTEMHVYVVNEICERLKENRALYWQTTPVEEKRLWQYKLWFLQQFYAYRVAGERYPAHLVECLLTLLNADACYDVLERVVCLLTSIEIEPLHFAQLSEKIDTLLNTDMQAQECESLLFLVSQLDALPVRNYNTILRYLNPNYFSLNIEPNNCPAFVVRILYACREHLENVLPLRNEEFWQDIILKPVPAYDRYMQLSILASVDLQEIHWLFQTLCVLLNENHEELEVKGCLDLIQAQIERGSRSKENVKQVMKETGLDFMLTRLLGHDNRLVVEKVEKIVDLLD